MLLRRWCMLGIGLGGFGAGVGCTESPSESDLAAESAALVAPGPSKVLRSAGGWTSGSAINGTKWTDPNNPSQTDPLENLTSAALTTPSPTGSSSAWGMVCSSDGCAGWPDRSNNLAFDQCPGAATADGVTRCAQLGGNNLTGNAQIFSAREQVSNPNYIGDNTARAVERLITLAAGRWKVSFDSVCALTDDAGNVKDVCDGMTDGATKSESSYMTLSCLDGTLIGAWSVPPYHTRSRFEAELNVPACAANGAILLVAAFNDFDDFKDEVTAAGSLADDFGHQKLANSYWRSTLIDNMRLEQLGIDASESQQGLADYLKLLGSVGVTATSSPTSIAWKSDHLERTEFKAGTPRTASYYEIWHAPKSPITASDVAVQETSQTPYFFVALRPEEVRPWTIATTAEAQDAADGTSALKLTREQSGDVVRQWFAVRNPSTGTSSVITPYFSVPPSWNVYAVIQAPILVAYTPSNVASLAATYKIVPAYLVKCGAVSTAPTSLVASSSPTDVLKCGDWTVPKGTTRSYVFEIPAGTNNDPIGTASRNIDLMLYGTQTVATDRLWASVTTIAPTGANIGRSTLWDSLPSMTSDVLARLGSHGIGDFAQHGYVVDETASTDPKIVPNTQTFTSSAGKSVKMISFFNSDAMIASAKAAGLQVGMALGGWSLAACGDIANADGTTTHQYQQLDGVTVDNIAYALTQTDLSAKTVASYPGKITCNGTCVTSKWTPVAGDVIAFWGNGMAIAAFGRIGKVSGNVMYLDVPFDFTIASGSKSGTVWRLLHAGPVNQMVTSLNGGAGTESCRVDDNTYPAITPVYQQCPTFAQVKQELTVSSAEAQTLWPVTCQRPLVDETASKFSADTITLTCYAYDVGKKAFAIDGNYCHNWFKLNPEQERLIDTVITTVAVINKDGSVSTDNKTLFGRYGISGKPLIRMDYQYDELARFRRLPMFDGFGQVEMLDIASRFERAGLPTTNEHIGPYSVEQQTVLDMKLDLDADGIADMRGMSFPVPMAPSTGSGASAKQNVRYGAAGATASELYYGGGFLDFARSPYAARATPGLARRKVAEDVGGATRGTIAWGLTLPAVQPDPFYTGTCVATYGSKLCNAVSQRDWLDFDGSGYAPPVKYNQAILIPSAASDASKPIDGTWDETALFSGMLEGTHDLKRAASLGVKVSAAIPYGVATGPVSTCTLVQALAGVTNPSAVCKDYQPK